ncbi:MAG: FecR domain-containing protein [Candidatus Andeanibacterium colombiense]|uniref:FecR domain-containing protein n=1 Tax=Candidatus Andeanibacterium colombiense TaxID=3121345 RepID=A0AAJ5X5W2_9SPHN|nr:MAG: FecR domain-containing protein [Sphingomonadaceae bacterium]
MSHYPSDTFRLGAANRDSEEEALGWVVRLTSGDASEDDAHEFALWNADVENAEAYDRARRLWLGLGPILEEQEAAGWPNAAPDPASGRGVGLHFPRMARYAAMAASLALVATASVQYFRVWQYDQVTGQSVRSDVHLADGSEVTMGPGTALGTDFAHGGRHVSLARGEAYFDVKHDPAHPFVVSAGNGVVRVLGTAFSVRKQDDGRVVVTVSRGRVQVTSGARSETLVRDRQISFGAEGLGSMRAVDSTLAMAWMRGRLIMENKPLGEVLEELDRYESGKIVLLNGEAAQRRINAVIDLQRTDSWLTALASSQGLRLTQVGPLKILR